MARRKNLTGLPAPFLRHIEVRKDLLADRQGYPFNQPWLAGGEFEIDFTTPVTIIVGENGTGKSTLIEAIGALAGYDEAGGGKGYRSVDHTGAVDQSGSGLGSCLRAHWLPKVTAGWFFRAETFFSVARYLDAAAKEANEAPPDFLSWSNGEGFIRFFEERCDRQGFFLFDEPESALSPARQIDLINLLARIGRNRNSQVIVATHSPLLMATPGARVMHITRYGLDEIDFRQTSHFRLLREFFLDPESFVEGVLDNREDG